jgi:hypothetical protein
MAKRMRKALIPALFVICGVLASRFWSTVGAPDGVCQAEMVGAVATGLLACAGTDLLVKELGDPALGSAVLNRMNVQSMQNNFGSFLSGTIEFQLQENKEK